MNTRKALALLLALCMVVSLTACVKDRDLRKEREASTTIVAPLDPVTPEGTEPGSDPVPATPEPKPLPTATSADVELYVATVAGEKYVCNAYGQRAAGYSVDESGNIVDADKNIVVAAANTEKFIPLTALSFASQKVDATLVAKEEASKDNPDITGVNQYPVNVTLLLSGTPNGATNNIVILSSSAVGIAEIRPNNNAKIIAQGDYNLQTGEVAIQLSEAGTARITVTAKSQGEATIAAKSLSGIAIAECLVVVANGEVQKSPYEPADGLTEMINASDDPTVHIHSYSKEVVNPTPYEKGYTLYTCACGHSYKDNYTSPLPMPTPEPTQHIHHYESSVVAPTATERGYTLHVCECGDSYKDCFVNPTGD